MNAVTFFWENTRNELKSIDLDTIPGRQSMAASLFLHRQFDEVLVYLTSIRVSRTRKTSKIDRCSSFQSYFYSDDAFNFNFAQAKAHEENWKEAEEVRR